MPGYFVKLQCGVSTLTDYSSSERSTWMALQGLLTEGEGSGAASVTSPQSDNVETQPLSLLWYACDPKCHCHVTGDA